MRIGRSEILSKHSIWFVQDQGRIPYNIYGIPHGGPMDIEMAHRINRLLGNSINDAVLEVFQTELSLVFNESSAICLGGLDADASINGQAVNYFSILCIRKGDVLKMNYTKNSPWRYVAIMGGWQTAKVFDSSSTYAPLGINATINNTSLNYMEMSVDVNDILNHNKESINYSLDTTINVAPGFDAHMLSHELLSSIFNEKFTISHQSNRQAYTNVDPVRLDARLPDITSCAVYPGTIQLTPSGKLYILMRDCQTTGGYLRVGFITQSELDKIVRLPFGSDFQFQFG